MGEEVVVGTFTHFSIFKLIIKIIKDKHCNDGIKEALIG